MTETVVALEDVFCVHRTDQGDAASLQGLTLAVAAGERVCVIGPSGAGKTTLLRVLAGLQPPSAGEVRVLGANVGRLSSRARARLRQRHIGFLHQHAERALSPDLPILEAVALPLAMRGAAPRERRRRALELLASAGLAERARARPGELSGGERQRAAVCAALVTGPALLLADEPTAELDPASADATCALLHDLARDRGATLIVVSHDALVSRGADRVLQLRDGRIVEDQGALVVGAGGWLRVDAGVLRAAGIEDRARVHTRAGRPELRLTPARVAGVAGVAGYGRSSAARVDAEALNPDGALTACGRAPARLALRSVDRVRGAGRARRVLADLSLEFAPGELTLVTGRSGSGKTSLLELVGLLAAPSAGEIELDGLRLGALGPDARAALRRARIGYLPQEPAPVAFLSAEENVALALRMRGRSAADAVAAARRALAQVGCDDRRRQRAGRLSAGEAQRVALARALACANGLLVVDEPTSRLDERSAATVARLLRRAANPAGHTVICATHDPHLREHADRIVDLGTLAS